MTNDKKLDPFYDKIKKLTDFKTVFSKANDKLSYISDIDTDTLCMHMVINRIIDDHDNRDVIVTNEPSSYIIELLKKHIDELLPEELKDTVEYKEKSVAINRRRILILSSNDDSHLSMRGFGVRHVVLHNFDKYDDEVIQQFMNSVYPVVSSGKFSKCFMTGEEKFTDCEEIYV
jgi:siroheme synthase (precorrin-2 oxidase/ferrochelatase)